MPGSLPGSILGCGLAVLVGCRWNFDASADARGTEDAASLETPPGPVVVYLTSGVGGTGQRLLTLELPTGELTELGVLTPTNILSGLAYWDTNTLYASGVTGDLVEITLSPLSAQVVGAIGGIVSSLDSDGSTLIGIDESSSTLVRMTPPSGIPVRTPILDETGTAVMAQGGDLEHLASGEWRWWSNVTDRLYRIDPSTARVEALGAVLPAPFVGGMIRDATDRLFLTSSNDDLLYEIDPTTGALLGTAPLCLPCPTPYDLQSGDATRSR